MTGTDGTSLTAQALIELRKSIPRSQSSSRPTSALPGGFAIKKRGQGQVISDSRVYVHGDEMRYVDRGATARTGTLHVRSFHEERDKVTFLVADFRPAMLWGMRRAFRSVAAAEALAWLGWQSVGAGGRVGLMAITAGDPIIVRTGGGTRGMLAVIGGLVQAHAAAIVDTKSVDRSNHLLDPPLDLALDGVHRIVPRGSAVIIATAFDSLGRNFDAVIGNLSRHRTPQFLQIEENALSDLPAGHYPLRGPDGQRHGARFQKTSEAEANTKVVAAHDLWRIDAGTPIASAMTQAGL